MKAWDYSVAYTCKNLLDDAEIDEMDDVNTGDVDESIEFIGFTNVTVTANTDSVVDFTLQ